jgi:short-subunit dehydrogenase
MPGSAATSYKPFLQHSETELLAIVQVNLIAAIQVCHALLPRLLQQGTGHVINIGSDLGRRPLANMAAYAASKHGLTGFSHSLLREVKAAGVRVSLVNTGMLDTGFGGAVESSDGDAAALLQPAAVAELIIGLIQQPPHVVVDELSVHPLGQAEF